VRIGFIGLGKMGRPMVRNLLKAGYEVVVHNRSRPPVDELAAEGAVPATSPVDVARQVDVVITSLPDPPTVRQVYLGPQGIMEAKKAGQLWVDTSTVDPETSRTIAAAAADRGGQEGGPNPPGGLRNAPAGLRRAGAGLHRGLGGLLRPHSALGPQVPQP